MNYYYKPIKYFCEIMKYKTVISKANPRRLAINEELATSPSKKYKVGSKSSKKYKVGSKEAKKMQSCQQKLRKKILSWQQK